MSEQRIVVDPITRIEGHLRVEVIVDENNVVKEAYSGSTLWRGTMMRFVPSSARLSMRCLQGVIPSRLCPRVVASR